MIATGMKARLRARVRPDPSPWAPIVARGLPPAPDPTGKRILCATSVGGHPLACSVDSIVAMAMWLRGVEPHFLLCDGALPACEECGYEKFDPPEEFVRKGPQGKVCSACFRQGHSWYRPLPLPLHRYSQFLSPATMRNARAEAAEMSVDECFTFERDGLCLGEQARASAFRFFGKAVLDDEPAKLVEGAARRFAAGAIVAAEVANRAVDEIQPDFLTAHHGVYVPQGVLTQVARQRGVKVVVWGSSYRNATVIYSHDDTYHHTLISEPSELWEDRPLSEAESDRLLRYLGERRRGRGDWKWVTPDAALRPDVQESAALVEELDLDTSLPTFGLLTNVLWDAQLYYAGHAFSDMLDWLAVTLDHFVERRDRQLIVRVHPHEVKPGNRQPVMPWLEQRYPSLPDNVKIVAHDHPYNTYALMELCRAVLIYGTKTGVELAPLGMPIVVAGDAWMRSKGITIDVTDRDNYLALLDRLPTIEKLDPATTERATRYAHHYFFRRMIPIASLDPDAGLPPPPRIERIQQLAPGNDPGLDVICDGILQRRPFVYDGPTTDACPRP